MFRRSTSSHHSRRDLSEAKMLIGHTKIETKEGKKMDYSAPAVQGEYERMMNCVR